MFTSSFIFNSAREILRVAIRKIPDPHAITLYHIVRYVKKQYNHSFKFMAKLAFSACYDLVVAWVVVRATA